MSDTPNLTFDEFDPISELPLVERRRYERSRLIIDLFFDGTDATGIASTRDIGVGGLYLNTQAVLTEGARLMLRIPFGKEHIMINTTVIYSNPGRGVGVRFNGLTEKERAAIETLSMIMQV
jgi:hypothetical protein